MVLMKNFHYCPRPFHRLLGIHSISPRFLRLRYNAHARFNRAHACTWDRSGNPLFFTSHGVTRQGKRSERIHSFLAKVHRFLYAHVDFLALRTFKQAANFEVALCPNYLINYLIILLIITSTASSLHQRRHHYIIITSSKFEFIFSDCDSVSNEELSLLPSSPFIAFSPYSSPFKWPAQVKTTHAQLIAHAHPTRGINRGNPYSRLVAAVTR